MVSSGQAWPENKSSNYWEPPICRLAQAGLNIWFHPCSLECFLVFCSIQGLFIWKTSDRGPADI